LWNLLDVWRRRLGTKRSYSASEVLSEARNDGYDVLWQAIEAVCPRGATPKSFGRFLSKVDGRIVDGLRIRHLPDKKRGGTYRVEEFDRHEQFKLAAE
jgi:hypothetical protein